MFAFTDFVLTKMNRLLYCFSSVYVRLGVFLSLTFNTLSKFLLFMSFASITVTSLSVFDPFLVVVKSPDFRCS